MGKRIVVALGGNAILTDDPSAQGQMNALRETSKHLIKLIQAGHEVIISHGNGPQVGNLLLQQAAADSPENPMLPLDSLVAMTQGSIGYWLQNVLGQALKEAGLEHEVASIVTQVVVDAKDPAFKQPEKPVGPFLTEEEAKRQAQETGDQFVEDAGRGYRKVVASPMPQSIVEAPVIESLVQAGVVTISAGGGGIPVVETDKGYEGIEAVVDKDFSSAKLAELVKADYLLILTGVENVYVNYNQPNQEKLEEVSVEQMKAYVAEDQFAAGSMLPKVQAALDLLENSPESQVIITSLENVAGVLDGESSATIIKA